MEYHIGQVFIGKYPPDAAIWATNHNARIDKTGENEYTIVEIVPEFHVSDYDDAMEKYLLGVRTARGYTTREPSDYYNSSVPRWASDAEDWIKFRDEVMVYSLAIMNHYEETGEAPSIEDFVANMPQIHWSLEVAEG